MSYRKSSAYADSEAARRMIAACNHQRWHIAQSLLDLYQSDIVHVRGIGNYDCTPLHAAAAAGQTDLLVALLEHGAEVDAPATHGYTPLYMAVRNNRPHAVRLLLHAGADPDITGAGHTPLATAVDKGFHPIVATLLDAGAATFVDNAGGDQPLHVAARHGHFDVVQALVEAGANVPARGARGLTPAQVASEAGFYDVAEYLRSGHAFSRSDAYSGRLVPYDYGRYPRSDAYGNLVPYDYGRLSDTYLDRPDRLSEYGPYDRFRTARPYDRFWDRDAYRAYGYGLGLAPPYDHYYDRHHHYGFGSRYRSRSLSPSRTDWSDDYAPAYYDDDHLYRRPGSHPYSSSTRLGRRERYRLKSYRSDDVAEMIGDFVGRAMSYSDKSRFTRRVERNAHRYKISGGTLVSDRYGSESLARMLVTDSTGYCKSEDLYATMQFIRAFRDGGSYAY